MSVVVSDELGQDLLEQATVEDEHSVEALAAHGAGEPLGEPIRTRGPDWRLDDLASSEEHLVEAGRELGVSVPDEEFGRVNPLGQDEAGIAGLLGDGSNPL